MSGFASGLTRLLAVSWGQFVAALVLLGSIRLYTELLPADRFGEAMLVLGGLGLVDGLTSMAFGQTCAQFLKDRADPSRRRSLGLALALRVYPRFALIAAIGCAVFAVFSDIRAVAMLALAGVLYVLGEPLRMVSLTVLQLERRYTLGSMWTALDALFSVAVSAALILFVSDQGGVLLLGAILGRAATTILLGAVILGNPRHWHADREAAREIWPRALAFSREVALMAPLGWLGFYLDRYLVGTFLGLEAAGLFAALGGAVNRPYAIVTAGLTNLFRPELLDQAAGRAPKISRPLLRWLGLCAVIGAAGTIAFLLLGDLVARWLIADSHGLIQQAGTLMTIMALSQWLVIQTHAVDNALLARGVARRMLVWQTVVLVAGAPLIALGAIKFGVFGAAWGRVGNEGLKLLAASALLASIRGTFKVRKAEAA